jgi:T5SS/PEP-CTERM-associated repeat protein
VACFAAVVIELGWSASVWAAVSEWISTGGGDWTSAPNWNFGDVPNGSEDGAIFGNAIVGPATVTVNADIRVNEITFESTHSYNLAGDGMHTLSFSSDAVIDVVAGSHTISARLISDQAGALIPKTGAGSLVLTGATYKLLYYVGIDAGTIIVENTQLNSNHFEVRTGVLSVVNGGVLDSVNLIIGNQTTETGIVTVDGMGSRLDIEDYLSISGTLTISRGGAVTLDAFGVGVIGDSGRSGRVIVDGQGSIWHSTRLDIGRSGSGELRITGGGNVRCFDCLLGEQPGSSGVVRVEGAGSKLTSDLELIVGASGTASLNVSGLGQVLVDARLHVGPNGIVDVTQNGAVVIGLGGAAVPGTVHVTAEFASITGSGKIAGDVLISRGRLAPGNSPGIIEIDGDYTQQANGVLEIEFGGLMPGTEHDQVIVTGNATLDGRLEVPVINDFVPQVGDEITFLTAAQRNGTFNALVAPNLDSVDPTLAFRVVYGPDNVRLRVVERSDGIQFDAVTEDANWSAPTTWSTGIIPQSEHAITIENLVDVPGVAQRVAMDLSTPALVHQLTVQDDSDPITVRVESGKYLSSTTGVMIGGHGVIELDGGNLDSSIVAVDGGGMLAGNGTVRANVSLTNGVLRPGFSVGHLDVVGNYQQGSNATLLMDIEGQGQFDTIDITGDVQLGGTLRIDASNLTTSNPGDSFEIITAPPGTPLVGAFNTIETVGNNDIYFSVRYDPGDPDPDVLRSAGVSALVWDRGDMNRSGEIDDVDFRLFVLGLMNPSRYFDECYCDDYGQAGGDFSGNGRLDFDDTVEFEATLNRRGMSAAGLYAAFAEYFSTVPEPSSVTLAVLGSLIIGLRRRSHVRCSG